jgi:hypothetical protein
MRVGSSGAPNPAISEVSHAVRLPLAPRWASGVPGAVSSGRGSRGPACAVAAVPLMRGRALADGGTGEWLVIVSGLR